MPWLTVPAGNLYYEAHGQGPSLVLLHGMWASLASWRKMVPELAEDHHVVLVDHMGHGRSDRVRTPYHLSTYASDLDLLLNHLGANSVTLVGFSLGALIAQEYYFRHRSNVTSLVLIATPPPYKFWWRVGLTIVSFMERLGITSIKKESVKALSRRYARGADRELADRSVKELSSYDDRGFALIVRSAWKKENAGKEREIQVPTLIVVGEQDRIRSHSNYLQRAISRSRLVVIPECDHAIIVTRPKWLAREIVHFLKDVHAAGSTW